MHYTAVLLLAAALIAMVVEATTVLRSTPLGAGTVTELIGSTTFVSYCPPSAASWWQPCREVTDADPLPTPVSASLACGNSLGGLMIPQGSLPWVYAADVFGPALYADVAYHYVPQSVAADEGDVDGPFCGYRATTVVARAATVSPVSSPVTARRICSGVTAPATWSPPVTWTEWTGELVAGAAIGTSFSRPGTCTNASNITARYAANLLAAAMARGQQATYSIMQSSTASEVATCGPLAGPDDWPVSLATGWAGASGCADWGEYAGDLPPGISRYGVPSCDGVGTSCVVQLINGSIQESPMGTLEYFQQWTWTQFEKLLPNPYAVPCIPGMDVLFPWLPCILPADAQPLQVRCQQTQYQLPSGATVSIPMDINPVNTIGFEAGYYLVSNYADGWSANTSIFGSVYRFLT